MPDRSRAKCLRRVLPALMVALIVGCADSQGLLVVVESSLYEPLEASLEIYAASLEAEGFDVYIEPWNSGTVDELKTLLFEHVDRHEIEGALLVGDLPAQWYWSIFEVYPEYFTTDLYLQDRDAIWLDRDGDGKLDYHSELAADIYTSRLSGTPTQLADYFARVEHYRHVGSLVDPSAFIFLDDDWSGMDTSDLFRLGESYRTVDVIQDRSDSTVWSYITKLTNDGAEFVYQWVHAAPGWMGFWHVDQDGIKTMTTLKATAVGEAYDFKVSFVNMANCYSASPYKKGEPSLAEAFTVGTDYGLAVIASTKRGAQTKVGLFHEKLAEGLTWGQAYKVWFNEEGRKNYDWNLGIVLMGDPLLRVRGDVVPSH